MGQGGQSDSSFAVPFDGMNGVIDLVAGRARWFVSLRGGECNAGLLDGSFRIGDVKGTMRVNDDDTNAGSKRINRMILTMIEDAIEYREGLNMVSCKGSAWVYIGRARIDETFGAIQ